MDDSLQGKSRWSNVDSRAWDYLEALRQPDSCCGIASGVAALRFLHFILHSRISEGRMGVAEREDALQLRNPCRASPWLPSSVDRCQQGNCAPDPTVLKAMRLRQLPVSLKEPPCEKQPCWPIKGGLMIQLTGSSQCYPEVALNSFKGGRSRTLLLFRCIDKFRSDVFEHKTESSFSF